MAGLLLAQTRPTPPIPKYEVKRAESPVIIDGKLDEKAWPAANTAELTFPWESQTGAKQKTVARLLWAVNGTLNGRSDKDRGWSLEVSMPWVNFEEFSKRPSPGTAWSFSLNRWDGVEPHRRMRIWSDSMQERPGPHAPERFGELLLAH
ncbi:MAG TPA: hypothetical protein VLH09_07330 [Bryobacteraceae bacterium]|nr:hypothetical protein [Bryobacteraceae bacterium]